MIISLFEKRALPVRNNQLACPLSDRPAISKCLRCAFYKSKKCPRGDRELTNLIQFPLAVIELSTFQQQPKRPAAQSHTL
jgi:hypothetical protein